jgi:hypothetical protein
MSLSLVSEVWDALTHHIDLNERKDAADTLVNFLIDAGFDADDIKEEFRGDKAIGNALKYYREQHEVEEEYEEEYEDDDEEW